MNLRTYRTYQAMIMTGLGLFLLFKVADGRILLYINQRFVILVLMAALALLTLAQVALRERPSVAEIEIHDPDVHRHHEQRSGWGLWLLALPLLVGLLIPQRPLGSSAVQNRGLNLGAVVSSSRPGSSVGIVGVPENQRDVIHWVRLASEGVDIRGARADVTGFVIHDLRLGAESFLVGRFAITCCVADATAYGMVVAWPDASSLPDNRWVRVRGLVSQVELDGRLVPAITAEQVDLVPEPQQPYLFP